MDEPKKPDLDEIRAEVRAEVPYPQYIRGQEYHDREGYEEYIERLARYRKQDRDEEYRYKLSEWRHHEKASDAYKSQPTPEAFAELVRQELTVAIKRHGLRAELLEPFLAQIPRLYDTQLFRDLWSAENSVREYALRMATKGPQLLRDALVELFTAYASRTPQDIAPILESPVYRQHHIRLRPLDLPDIPMPEVIVDPDLAFSGTWVVSPQGRGKTTLLSKLILDRINEPCSIIVFDSKGDLADRFRERKYPKDVVIIDPLPHLALNPFDLGTHSTDTLMTVYSMLLDASVTPLQMVLLRHAVYLCTHIPHATIATLRDIFVNGVGKYAEAVRAIEDDEERNYWVTDFPSSTYTKTRQELLWRLELLRPPGTVLRTIFNAPETRVKLPALMDGNTLTIINNSRAILSPYQSEFFARLFLVMILGAAEQRARLPEAQKHPCYVFIDEAQNVISTATELTDIIYQCRSQKIAMLCAHQSLSQIQDKQVQSALGDCAIKYANSDDDAHALAPKLRTTPETLQSLQVGEFALSLRGQPTQTVKIPLPDFSPYPLLSKVDIEARDAEMARRYHYTPTKKALVIPDPPKLTDVPTDDETTWDGKKVL